MTVDCSLLTDKDRQIAWVEGKRRELEGLDRNVLRVNDTDAITLSTNSDPNEAATAVLRVRDESDPDEITLSTKSQTRRRKGEGTGRIQFRTITRKSGKQYKQAWYDWEIQEGGKAIKRSTYISKRLLPKVLEMEAAKSPVAEILDLLGVK